MIWSVRKVLALAPHTDDAEIGAGGLISRLVEQGATLHSVAFSTAQESLPAGLPEDTLAREAREAVSRLGISEGNLQILDYPVRRFPQFRQEILEDLVKLRREIEPDLVLVHASTDVHQDHHTVYSEAVRAFKTTTILGYELPWNNLAFHAHAVVALEARHLDQKLHALQAYQSQSHRHYASEEFIRGWARGRGVSIGAKYAEAFEVIRWVMR